jgi:hypothetical protein
MFNQRVLPLSVLAILGMFVTNASGAVTNVFVERIEVTQAVQCLDVTLGYTACPDNSLELEPDEPVVVRVYIGHEGAPECPQYGHSSNPSSYPHEPVVELKGTTVRLWWAAAHASDYLFPLGFTEEVTFDVPCSTNLLELRKDARGSATFTLPTSTLGKFNVRKALRVEAEVIPPPGVQDWPTSDNTKLIQLGHQDDQGNDLPGGFVPVEPISVLWMAIDYRPNDSVQYDKYTGPRFLTDFDQPARNAAYMKTIYPMRVDFSWSNSFLSYGSHPVTGAACDDCPDVRDDGAGGVLWDYVYEARNYLKWKPDVFVGYLPGEATGRCRGVGNHGAAWVSAGCASPAGQAVVLAHEVGHGVNLDHPSDSSPTGEPCWPFEGNYDIEEQGYSFLDQEPVRSDTWDFMQPGGSGYEWISPYMWNRLLNKAFTTEWSACDSDSSKTALSSPDTASPEPVILISGSIMEDGSGELDSLFAFTGEGPFPASDPSAPYCVDLETSSRTSLATHCFSLPVKREARDTDSSAGGFAFLRPFPSSATRVVLRQDSTTLDMRTASSNAPVLIVDEPQGGDVDPAEVSWTASDPDADQLTFTVLYSPDGGNSLFPVAIDVEAAGPTTGLEINSALMAGSSNALFRVLASDGFNTTVVDSDRFEVTRKPPTALVFAPEDGALVDFTADVVLAGYGGDLEDGELEGSSLQWSSSRDGALGEGSTVVLSANSLTPGQHEITLTATDSDGMSAAASVTVSVFLPINIDIKPFSYPNSIRLKNKGVVPVAVCNGGPVTNVVDIDDPGVPSGFNGAATNIDLSTLQFALDSEGVPLGTSTANPAHDLSRAEVLGDHLTRFVDTDADRVPDALVYLDAPNCAGAPDGPDLVVHFPRRDIGLARTDTEACVKATLDSGVVIIGCDTVRVPR